MKNCNQSPMITGNEGRSSAEHGDNLEERKIQPLPVKKADFMGICEAQEEQQPIMRYSKVTLQRYKGRYNLSSAKKVHVSTKIHKWEIDEAKVKHPPKDFPIAKTSRFFPGTSPNGIAKRIVACLQVRSIQAKFSKAGPLAKCRNLDFVKFHVRLYVNDGGTFVEVQRTSGDCVSFMQDYLAILHTCGKDASIANISMESKKPSNFYLLLPKDCIQKNVEFHPPDTASGSIKIIANLLSNDRIDENMIGMKSLAYVSDAAKTHKETSLLTAKVILCSDKHINLFLGIHKRLMSIIINGYQAGVNRSGGDESAMSDLDERFRNLALCAISNALGILLEDGCLFQTIESNQSWFLEGLIPRLVEDVVMAHERPHNACYASRCLSHLALLSSFFAARIREEGLPRALENAEQVGNEEFALLASDAHKCRDNLVQCF